MALCRFAFSQEDNAGSIKRKDIPLEKVASRERVSSVPEEETAEVAFLSV